MESEERPAKIRKVDHVIGHEDTPNVDAASLDSEIQDLNGNQAEDQPLDHGKMQHIPDESVQDGETAPKLSKNQLKKQKRLERWEAGREDRKIKRKEKIKAKKERKREEWAEHRANGEGSSSSKPTRTAGPQGVQVPLTVIFDCEFEDLMFDNELKSLGLQITRCYSDNRKAPYRCHLAVSSFGGKMKERFDGILAQQYKNWAGFRFFEEDFVKVSEMATDWMKDAQGGVIEGALKASINPKPVEEHGDGGEEEGEVVYLSAESDVTLERLKPNSTYIIGGLVDKNRHKGLCYKRALERGIKTAKLPIGEFLQMKSRQVLVTNHVLEIMLKWMEFDDWGKAFMEVIPKRKGGVLKSEADQDGDEQETPEEAGAVDDVGVQAQTAGAENVDDTPA